MKKEILSLLMICLIATTAIGSAEFCIPLSQNYSPEDLTLVSEYKGYSNMIMNRFSGNWIENPQTKKSYMQDVLNRLIDKWIRRSRQIKCLQKMNAGETVTCDLNVNY